MRIVDLYSVSKQKDRDVGIEIEMEGSGIVIPATGWRLEEDGSLRHNPEAIEYVLDTPVNRKDVTAALQTLQLALDKAGAKLTPSDRCGVHVHINCQQLTVEQVISFITLYLIMEEPLVKWCGEDREGNPFTLRAKDAEYTISLLIQSAMRGDFNQFNSDMRYGSVNPNAIQKYGSLEFRALRTPKDFAIIDTWTRLLLRIKDASLEFQHPKSIIEACSAAGFGSFAKRVLGDMSETIQCKGMASMIAEGVRRVQDIAYVDVLVKKKEKQPKLKDSEVGAYEWARVVAHPGAALGTDEAQPMAMGAGQVGWYGLPQLGGTEPAPQDAPQVSRPRVTHAPVGYASPPPTRTRLEVEREAAAFATAHQTPGSATWQLYYDVHMETHRYKILPEER